MELVADLKFMLKSSNAWDQLRSFGFIQEVSGKNVSTLILIMIFLVCKSMFGNLFKQLGIN